MKLNIAKKIDENIITVDITVEELGTTDTDSDSERGKYARRRKWRPCCNRQ